MPGVEDRWFGVRTSSGSDAPRDFGTSWGFYFLQSAVQIFVLARSPPSSTKVRLVKVKVPNCADAVVAVIKLAATMMAAMNVRCVICMSPYLLEINLRGWRKSLCELEHMRLKNAPRLV